MTFIKWIFPFPPFLSFFFHFFGFFFFFLPMFSIYITPSLFPPFNMLILFHLPYPFCPTLFLSSSPFYRTFSIFSHPFCHLTSSLILSSSLFSFPSIILLFCSFCSSSFVNSIFSLSFYKRYWRVDASHEVPKRIDFCVCAALACPTLDSQRT